MAAAAIKNANAGADKQELSVRLQTRRVVSVEQALEKGDVGAVVEALGADSSLVVAAAAKAIAHAASGHRNTQTTSDKLTRSSMRVKATVAAGPVAFEDKVAGACAKLIGALGSAHGLRDPTVAHWGCRAVAALAARAGTREARAPHCSAGSSISASVSLSLCFSFAAVVGAECRGRQPLAAVQRSPSEMHSRRGRAARW